MNRIERLSQDESVIFIINYSDLRESGMIDLIRELKSQILSVNKPVMVLSIYNEKSFGTPKFMREAENVTREVLPLLKKQAIVGLSETKKMILKGYNFLFKKNIPAFDTKEKAMEYLIDEKTSNRSGFWDPVGK